MRLKRGDGITNTVAVMNLTSHDAVPRNTVVGVTLSARQ